MDFINKLLLRCIAAFYPVIERTGVDTLQLNEILRIKLLIDARRPRTMFAGRRKAGGAVKPASSWGVNIVLLIMGAFIGMIPMIFVQPLVGQTLYFIVFMVLMALTLISDFTT